jgi:predicted nucleic acid-binding protein
MPVADASGFLDSNVLLYLLSTDAAKANCAQRLLKTRPVISVQVLNEVTHVCRRKIGMDWGEIAEFLNLVRRLCKVVPLTEATHDQGRALAERYQISFYDACIAAAAVLAGCATLFSEDFSNGQVIEKSLTVSNPFLA